MKKFLTLRIPILLAILIIVLTLGLVSMKVGALIGDYWDIGPWRVDSSGYLLPDGDSTRNLGSSSYAIATAHIDSVILGYTTVAAATDALVATDCGFVNVRYATCTVTLPTTVGNTGLWFLIKHSTTTTGVVTLTPLVYGQLIDGSATNVELDAEYDILGIFSDGANWLVWTRDQ